jgi:hypothetical protein
VWSLAQMHRPARKCGLTLPSRGQLPGYALQLPLMSNVRALASIRIFVIHRRVAHVAILLSGCPSFGSQRKVEPPAGKDSWFRHEAHARHRRGVTWLPFAASKKPETWPVRIQDGERRGRTEESNTMRSTRLHAWSVG